MKQKILTTATALVLYISIALAQSGVGIDQPNMDPSAVLDIFSLEQGVLLPRMDSSTIAVINLPANGLVVYNIDDNTFHVNTGDQFTPRWKSINPDMAVGFLVYPDGGQQIPPAIPTLVDFVPPLPSSPGFNDGNHFDYTNDYYRVPYTGVYQFNTNVTIFDMIAFEQWTVEIWVDDGSGPIAVASNISSPPDYQDEHSGSVSATLKLKKNSKVFVRVEQIDPQGAPHNLSSNSASTWFSGHRLY